MMISPFFRFLRFLKESSIRGKGSVHSRFSVAVPLYPEEKSIISETGKIEKRIKKI